MKQNISNFGVIRKISTICFIAILSLCTNAIYGQSGNNIVIDGFDDTEAINIVATPEAPRQSIAIPNASVLGGERDMIVELTDGVRDAEADILSGEYSLSVSAGSSGRGSLIYDGGDGDADNIDFTGLGGIDLERGLSQDFQTEDRFKLTVVDSDLDGTVTITIYSDESRSSTVTRNFTGATDFEIMFSEFSGNADFNDVGAIVIETGGDAIDVLLDRICTEGPPPTCRLESITAGAPTCVDFPNYTVTVNWVGVDETVTISAGGNGSPASVVADASGTATFTYSVETDPSYNITFNDTDGLCGDIGAGLSGDAPPCEAPRTCELTGISASAPSCIDYPNYTVTVSWTGADESVSILAGGNGTPASVVADGAGSAVFTYSVETDPTYNITFNDSEGLCSADLGASLSGNAPPCEPPAMCDVSNFGASAAVCVTYPNYSVTVSWSGSDETVTITAGGTGTPASVVATGAGSQTFTYPITDETYSISVVDSEGLCDPLTFGGSAPPCEPPFIGVPTMGEWGLISLSLIFLIFGTMAMRKYVFTPSVTK